jgi:hypothetical protein
MATIHEVRRATRKWQEILCLRDWRFFVKWGKVKDLARVEAVGLCVWTAEERAAEIVLARRQTDLESTLVHEMLHVVLEGHKNYSGRYDVHQERIINGLAQGYLSLQRFLAR